MLQNVRHPGRIPDGPNATMKTFSEDSLFKCRCVARARVLILLDRQIAGNRHRTLQGEGIGMLSSDGGARGSFMLWIPMLSLSLSKS